jgi:hypothetical protein
VTQPAFDADGYPTDDTLAAIEAWKPEQGVAAWLDFAAACWHWPEFVSRELRPEEALIVQAEADNRYLRLATGGWSGNESVIGAMRANRLLSAFTWRLTACGGLHIYRYPEAGQYA